MLYMSDDRKRVFKTEQECCTYEQNLEQERVKKEKLEMERQNKIDAISKKYEELQRLVSEYERDYCVKQKPYFAPVYDLMNMLRI